MTLIEVLKPYKIYVDLDQTLTAFNDRFEYFTGMLPKEYEQKNGTKKFWQVIDDKVGTRFWVDMPWMKDGKELWEYVKKYEPEILSSPSRSATSKIGKQKWMEKQLPGVKLNLARSDDKQNYSGSNKILIDDRADLIKQWENHGGVGIRFISTTQTISELKKLGL